MTIEGFSDISTLLEYYWGEMENTTEHIGLEFAHNMQTGEVKGAIRDFCKKSWPYIMRLEDPVKAQLKFLEREGTKDSPYSPERFVKSIVRVAAEYILETEDSRYLRQRFGLTGKDQNKVHTAVNRFLSEIVLEPNLGFAWIESEAGKAKPDVRKVVRKVRKMYLVEKESPESPIAEICKTTSQPKEDDRIVVPYLTSKGITVDTLSLMCYVLDNYEDKLPVNCMHTSLLSALLSRNKRQRKGRRIEFDSVSVDGIKHQAFFADSCWRNLYHNVRTCKFNGESEMLASMLECADSHIHHLLIAPLVDTTTYSHETERVIVNGQETGTANMLAILYDMADSKGREYILVEGVFGTPYKNDTSKKKLFYDYVYSCLVSMAKFTGRGLIINYGFSGHYPSQGPPDFVNYVHSIRNADGEAYYVLSESPDGKKSFVHRGKEEEMAEQFSKLGLRKLPCPAVDAFCSYRRNNTFFEWTKAGLK